MRYSLTFLALGAAISFLGIREGGWWNLLHWFSLSFLALAIGHAGVGPRIFAKRLNGRIPFWSKVAHLPFIVFSDCVWWIAKALSREHPTDVVSETLILGRRLGGDEIPSGFMNYVDLTAETEDPVEARESSAYVALPILDASVPSAEALHATISSLKSGATFVYCAQGHGRTGLFALALLAEHGEIHTVEEGLKILRSARPGVGLNPVQTRFIRQYIARFGVSNRRPVSK